MYIDGNRLICVCLYKKGAENVKIVLEEMQREINLVRMQNEVEQVYSVAE